MVINGRPDSFRVSPRRQINIFTAVSSHARSCSVSGCTPVAIRAVKRSPRKLASSPTLLRIAFSIRGFDHGFRLDKGVFTAIDFPDSASTDVWGLNECGEVVGSYIDSAGVNHGFVLIAGQFHTLDVPGAGSITLMMATRSDVC
jgi:hypothetical protein